MLNEPLQASLDCFLIRAFTDMRLTSAEKREHGHGGRAGVGLRATGARAGTIGTVMTIAEIQGPPAIFILMSRQPIERGGDGPFGCFGHARNGFAMASAA
jgi:hypothetical protein